MTKDSKPISYDVIIIGAGAAGLMCAIQAGRRGRTVLVLDHLKVIGGKILVSGGGRCNFTNLNAGPNNYLSHNPHFCKSALSRFPPESFIQLLQAHEIPFHEKKLGQLFCDRSAHDILNMLKSECEESQVQFGLDCKIHKIDENFRITSSKGIFTCNSLVIATGGLAFPQLGASGFGYEIAKQFDLKIVETAPALDGFIFSEPELSFFKVLSGISLECAITCGKSKFQDSLLFTHRGLSGPAALQASLYWQIGDKLTIDLLPEMNLFAWFLDKKRIGNLSQVKNLLGQLLPMRLSEQLCQRYFPSSLPLPQVSEKALEIFCQIIHKWNLNPNGTAGYRKAEVTRGGVDTDELSSQTMGVQKCPGLHFIGEVVDVTGQLGGYNFQWAWASGWAAGQYV